MAPSSNQLIYGIFRRKKIGAFVFRLAPILAVIGMSLASTIPQAQTLDISSPQRERDLDRRIDGYVPIMKITDRYVKRNGKVDPEAAISLAQMWNDHIDRGVLRPLSPTTTDPERDVSVIGQVVNAGTAIAGTLVNEGRRKIGQGEFEEGSQMTVLGMRSLRAIANTDVQSHMTANIILRRGISQLQSVWPKLSEPARAKLRLDLERLVTNPAELSDMGFNYQRLATEGKPFPGRMELAKANKPVLNSLLQLRSAPKTAVHSALADALERSRIEAERNPANELNQMMKRVLIVEMATQRDLLKLLQ